MNFPIILSIILVAFWIITALTGSDWLWSIIIFFPIFILFRTREKINYWYIIILIALFFIIWIGFINEWLLSFGDIIVMVYLLIIFFVVWILFNIKQYSWENMSPYAAFSFIATIIATVLIANIMPAPLPVSTTPTTISNTGTVNKVTTWTLIQPEEMRVKELNNIIERAKSAKYVVINTISRRSQDGWWYDTLDPRYKVYKVTPVVRLNDFSSDFIPTFNVGKSTEVIHRSQLEEYFFNPQKFPITDYCVTITPASGTWWIIQEFSQCYLHIKASDTLVPLSQYYK